MMMAGHHATPSVLKLTGPITLDWGNGVRITLSPAGIEAEGAIQAASLGRPRGRPGRKPSPPTQALIAAMQSDQKNGITRSRSEYLAVLRDGGHNGSEDSGGIIVNREAKRIFGHSLGRRTDSNRRAFQGGKRGRGPAPATVLLRKKLQADKATGSLRDAKHYLGWLMDQPGLKIGLKPAKPIVYRELRAAR